MDPTFTPDGKLIVYSAVAKRRMSGGDVVDLWRLRRVRVRDVRLLELVRTGERRRG